MKRNMYWPVTFIFSAIILAANLIALQPASAAVIYSQPLRTNPTFGGQFSNAGGQIVADQFILTNAASITGVRWWGFYNGLPAPPNDEMEFTLQFLGDEGGQPMPVPDAEYITQALVTDSGYHIEYDPGGYHLGLPVYQFDALLSSPFIIDANDMTWLSVFESDPLTPDAGDSQWLWSASQSNPGDMSAYRNGRGGPWQPYDSIYSNLSFELIGDPILTVNEPNSIALVGLGLMSIMVVGAMRKSRA
jgi:hypothetical protein